MVKEITNFVRIHELCFLVSDKEAPAKEAVTSSEREDFKLSIGSLNNKFSYMVEGLLNILQQHNMAANGNKECKPKSHML